MTIEPDDGNFLTINAFRLLRVVKLGVLFNLMLNNCYQREDKFIMTNDE